MKKHTKTYLDYFGYGEQDVIQCEVCPKVAVDIHHIMPKGMGGKNSGVERIENYIALCRDCHDKAHEGLLSKAKLNKIHKPLIRP